MALIKCNECGHEVSDKASVCPNCGCPIEKKLTCEECGNQLSANDTTCPNCGCPIPNKNGGLEKNGLSSSIPAPVNSAMTSSPQIAQKDSSKSSNAIYYILGVVGYIILSIFGCGLIRQTYPPTIETEELKWIIFAIESTCCAVAAIIMICFVTKPMGNRLAFSILVGVFTSILIHLIRLTGLEYSVGFAIIEFIIHLTLIIIAVYKRREHD